MKFMTNIVLVAGLLALGGFGQLARAQNTSELCSAMGSEAVDHIGIDGRTLASSTGKRYVLVGIMPSDLITGSGATQLDAATGPTEHADIRIREVSGKDRYGRVGVLAFANGSLLQKSWLRSGHAFYYPEPGLAECAPLLLEAERFARVRRIGIWTVGGIRINPAISSILLQERGRFVIFEGHVVSVGTRPERTYLNFGTKWSQDATVEIRKRHRAIFGGDEALQALAGRHVRIRGIVREKAGAMVEAYLPGQIEVITNSVSSVPGAAPPVGQPEIAVDQGTHD